MEHTDLVAYIQILVEKKQDCDRPKYLWQIAGALNYVHEKGVVYGDMKAQNILISGQDRAYLCDFGSAYMESSPAESHPPANCTFRNMAPELFGNPREKKPKSTKASDVYSFGMTIYEVLSGKDPLFKYNAMDKLGEAVIKGERPPLEPSTSSGGRSYDRLWAVATDCWKGDPNSRPLMKDVYARMKDDPPKLQPGGSSKPKRQ
ncbi:hypothetical protein FRB99_003336 [Tulasnella sp. 403]|nr:hypothetical protein FRB99_003336 [Tulasnella sp. 403]